MFEEIRDVIAEKLDIAKEQITMESVFEDLKIDSLDMVEIVCDLEEKYNINFDKDAQPTNVAELVAQVEALVK